MFINNVSNSNIGGSNKVLITTFLPHLSTATIIILGKINYNLQLKMSKIGQQTTRILDFKTTSTKDFEKRFINNQQCFGQFINNQNKKV